MLLLESVALEGASLSAEAKELIAAMASSSSAVERCCWFSVEVLFCLVFPVREVRPLSARDESEEASCNRDDDDEEEEEEAISP